MAATGFLTAALSLVMLLQTLYNYFFTGAAVGFTTVIALQGMIGVVVLSALGIVAAYLALIYKEIKHSPIYVINRPYGYATGPRTP